MIQNRLTPEQIECMRHWLSYDPMTGDICWRLNCGKVVAGTIAGSSDGPGGYRRITVRGIKILGHRAAWILHHGREPVGNIYLVNEDLGDLRIDNLHESPACSDDLTVERLRALLHYDPKTGVFRWKVPQGRIRAGSIAGYKGSRGYWQIMIDRSLHLAHRLAWLYVTGQWPKDQIDHKNLCRTDNWIENLREATSSQNNCNRPRTKVVASGYHGVYLNKSNGKYRVRPAVQNRRENIGTFENAKEAHDAYSIAIERLHGEFARAA